MLLGLFGYASLLEDNLWSHYNLGIRRFGRLPWASACSLVPFTTRLSPPPESLELGFDLSSLLRESLF